MPDPSLIGTAKASMIARQLAQGKAARLAALQSLPGYDREDIEAELMLGFLRSHPRFDGQRSLRTFASRVMDRYAVSMMRRAHAQRRLGDVNSCSLNDTVACDGGSPVEFGTTIADPETDSSAIRKRDLAIDVARDLDRLPAATRHAAIALSTVSPSEAGRTLGMSRTWVYEQIARLREAFLAAGLAPPFARARTAEGNGGIE